MGCFILAQSAKELFEKCRGNIVEIMSEGVATHGPGPEGLEFLEVFLDVAGRERQAPVRVFVAWGDRLAGDL